jgi:ligand-binding SRPBCC domain-containing protein
MIKFESRLWVPSSIEDVWSFFSNPRNLAQMTPPFFRAEIESESSIREDSTVVVTLKPWIYPPGIKWVSKIHSVSATGNDRAFVDVQAAGPFSHWKHTHKFSAGATELKGASGKTIQNANGGTWIIDEIEYELPLGVLGKIADKLFNKRQLQSTFSFRYEALRKEFKL